MEQTHGRSSFGVIRDVSLELRRRVGSALEGTAGVELEVTDADIRLDPPPDEAGAQVGASLYLYKVDISLEHMNRPTGRESSASEIRRGPPLPLELRYLLTPCDVNESNNQLLVGRVLQFFHDNPRLDMLDGQPPSDGFGGTGTGPRVGVEPLTTEQMTRLWGALGKRMRLSVSLLVRPVALDSGRSGEA